ncbi:hypothetical protein [Acinetobacter parvus]|uniref:hypothetical protein n=1 Tax=Acinetobacter parvus TaxID=134533 RepID=UPI00391BBF11
MHFYDPVSKIIKPDLKADVEAWLDQGNQITVLPSYTQAHKASHHIDDEQRLANKAKIAKLNNWLNAKPGRVTKLIKHLKIGSKLFISIRLYKAPCKMGLYKKFEEAMVIIEQGENK